MAKRVVLAYSGGLDTSVAVRWMIEHLGVEVVCLSADVGQEGTLEGNREKALGAGAIAYEELDLREEFADDFLAPFIKANALYEDQYPLVSALSRPLIAQKQVEIARKYGADGVAHVVKRVEDGDEIIIEENGHKGKSVATENSQLAGEMNYTWAGPDKLIIDHTEVNPDFAGRGIGKLLLMEIVKMAREKKVKIMPLCPFARSVFDKSPELNDILF